VEAIFNVPMVTDATSEFIRIARAGTDVEHRFVLGFSSPHAGALNPNQAFNSDPGDIESNTGIEDTHAPLRDAISGVFNLVYHTLGSMLLKLILHPLIERRLILFHGDHVVIATVDDLLYCFFGCATHPD
jgi:hypothetical protein